ncbi:MAG TPA: sigma-70 family RNA polymerase sigma factor [Pyrinomonadaceae bacterium]|jgi:RNA polymerase sigma factor for flagellar operon FliA
MPPSDFRDQLIEQHRPYVRALAVKIMRTLPMRVDLNELVAYGDVGLVEAAQRYDSGRGAAFRTFAHYRIRGAIYDGLREMGLLTRSSSQRTRFAANANNLLQSGFSDLAAWPETAPPSVDDEIAATQALIDTLIPAYLLSIDSDAMPEVADQNAFSVQQIEQRELIGIVRELLAELPKDEQQLLDRLYFKHQSMTELAKSMGISKSWISRLHMRAIRHLRDRMQERQMLEPPD